MSFVIFIAMNAVFFIRPEELFPEISGLRLYLVLMCFCVLLEFKNICGILSPEKLFLRPVTFCVLGVFVSGVVSQLAVGQVGVAVDFISEYGKVVLFYLLMLCQIDSQEKLRKYIASILLFVFLVAVLAIFQYHNYVDLEALRPLERNEFVGSDDSVNVIMQLRGTGVNNDPNDFCLVLNLAVVSAFATSQYSKNILAKILWLSLSLVFIYAIFLTQSRGGFLGMASALIVLGILRFGFLKATVMLSPLFVVFVLASSRQSDISKDEHDTLHERIQLWHDGFNSMKSNPITGIGVGNFSDQMGLVAHNSFVHAFVEMGFCGGSFFASAFVISFVNLFRLTKLSLSDDDKMSIFLSAIVAGYAVGIFSISRNYVVSTLIPLGLAESYIYLKRGDIFDVLRCGMKFCLQVLLIGALSLSVLFLISRIFI